MPLPELGWNEHHQHHFEQLPDRDALRPARVMRRERTLVVAHDGARETQARLDAALRKAPPDASPTTGDWVALDADDVARHVLPRRTRFSRAEAGGAAREQVVAANVDVVLLVAGLDGDFNVRRLERYVALARASGARPVVVLNKADACADPDAARREAEAVAAGAPVLLASAATGAGLDALRALVAPGVTVALLGSSGVGKSTIVNRLLGEERFATQPVREHDARGRHTTTRRELVPLPGGGLLLDTPGMRELGLPADGDGLAGAFEDVESLARLCRFRDCRHESEPGCAVRAAIASGELDAARFESYLKLQRELAWRARRRDEAARRDMGPIGRAGKRLLREHHARKREERGY